MITSKKLSPERIAEIMEIPVTYDEESPKLTADQIARMKPIRILEGRTSQSTSFYKDRCRCIGMV